MKAPFTLGQVGHFGLAVRDPKKSAKWFEQALGLRKEFEFDGGVAIGNDNVTIALFRGKPSPGTIDHMSFHLSDMQTLRHALTHLKKIGADIEDPTGKGRTCKGFCRRGARNAGRETGPGRGRKKRRRSERKHCE
jgi:catechol 2,3-dioxygenase-like lactoylglutathione lyase family enzyme